MDEPLLSSSDVARRLGVTASTVKRWADVGLLRPERTLGGHRRFRLPDVLTLERSLRLSGSVGRTAPTWSPESLIAAWSSSASTQTVVAELVARRAELGSWGAVGDRLGEVLEALGKAWTDGKLSVAEEHTVSTRLERALAFVSDSIPAAPDARRCLLACIEGEEHTLALSIAEVCLRESGWSPYWVGRSVPTGALTALIRSERFPLVALSGSRWSRDKKRVAACVSEISLTCRKARSALVVGGGAAWPAEVRRVSSFIAFSALLRAAVERGAAR